MDFLITHPQNGQEAGLLPAVLQFLKKQVSPALGELPTFCLAEQDPHAASP